MPLKNFNILAEVTTAVCDLFELQGFKNISVTNDSDIVEIPTERQDKFPAIIFTGPRININKFVKGQGLYGDVIISKDLENKTFQSKKPPQIIDAIYDIIIMGEEDQEVMMSVLNVLNIFQGETRIQVREVEYRVYLLEAPDIDNITNYTDLIQAKGKLLIEGVEIEFTDVIETGHLLEDGIVNIVNQGGDLSYE